MKTLTAAPAGYKIERVHLATASDDLMRQVVAVIHANDADAQPEDPPMPAEMIEARFRTTSPFFERAQWVAVKDGRVAARVTQVRNKSGSNEDKRDIDLIVHPEHRRRGLGRALFSAAVAEIPDDEARLVQWWTHSRVPAGVEFSKKLGAKAGLHMRASQLDLKAIDRAKMDEWAVLDPADYKLEFIKGDVPEELMAVTVDAFNAINRMPREGLDMDDWKFTPEMIRDWERQRRERGNDVWLILAVHQPTGEAAGFTDVFFDKRYLHVIQQGGTAVDMKHRSKGIGKWMKARMVNQILTDLPDARFIRTENAGSNAAMLGINIAMGFALAWEHDIWQLPLADAKKYAEGR